MCVCVSVSVREDISGTTRAIFTSFCACCQWPCSVLLRQGDKIPSGRGSFGGFFPNAFYIIAFATHTKTAEPIVMPFGMKSGLSPRNTVLREGDDLRREWVQFWEKHVPDKPNTPMNCELDWTMQRRAHDGADAWCKRWTSLLSAAKVVRLHTAGEVWYLRLPCDFSDENEITHRGYGISHTSNKSC